MPKFRIIAERYVEEAWTLIVEAETEEDALQMVEDCPWGDCDGVEHKDDVTSYRDEVEYRCDGTVDDTVKDNEGEDFSITEGINSLSKFNIIDEKIIEKIAEKIKIERVIPHLEFINKAFEEENVEISDNQAYFFTSDVLISDKELQGFLYVNMDGFYSNCLEDDLSFLVTWDVVIDMNIVQEIDGIEIEIKTEDGELTIKEKNSKSLKILYSFYKNVWQQVIREFKDKPNASWNSVFEMGIQGIGFNTLEEYIEWSNEDENAEYNEDIDLSE